MKSSQISLKKLLFENFREIDFINAIHISAILFFFAMISLLNILEKIVTQFCYFKEHLPGFMFVYYRRFNLERKEKLKTTKNEVYFDVYCYIRCFVFVFI